MLSSRLLSIIHLSQTRRIREHKIYNLLRDHSIGLFIYRRIDDRVGLFINTERDLAMGTIYCIIGGIVVLVKVELKLLSFDPVKLHCKVNVVYREFILITDSTIISSRDLDISSFILIKSLNQSIRCRICLTSSAITTNHNFTIVRYYLDCILICLCTRKIKQLTRDDFIITTKPHESIVHKLRHIKFQSKLLTKRVLHSNSISHYIVL